MAFVNRSRILTSGQKAELIADRFVADSVELVIDGTPQSHLNLQDPANVFFEYVQRIANFLDILKTPGAPVTALHLGGGAFTLPRYIEATRPGSRQQIIELDETLIAFVREFLPLPKRASMRVRQGDARAKLRSLPKGLHGAVDAVIVDVFSGATVPAHLTSQEFYRELKQFLHAESIVLINIADGPGLHFTRKQVATVQSIFEDVHVTAHAQVLNGKLFGNIIIVAGSLQREQLQRAAAAGPHPAKTLSGNEIKRFIAGAKPVVDEGAKPSPKPPHKTFEA